MSDIRTGKLGIRRAAAMYGIPRSTLRNKLFKHQSNRCIESVISQSDLYTEKLPNLLTTNLIQNIAFKSDNMETPFINDHNRMFKEGDDSWEERLEMLRKKHNLDRAEHSFGLRFPFREVNTIYPYGSLDMTRLQQTKSTLSLESYNGVLLENGSLDLSMPKWSFAKNRVDLKIPSFTPTIGNSELYTKYVNSSNNSINAEDSPDQNTICPATPRWAFHSVANDNNFIGEQLKHIIAKSITERVRVGLSPITESDSENSFNSDNEKVVIDVDGHCKSLKCDGYGDHILPTKRSKTQKVKQGVPTNSDITDTNDVKKTRPKRGQYRRYNSQLLVDAVNAVQRGEMSVHRAGSYYGVPHSTLEYKVKERHLLRQRKSREIKRKSISKFNGLDKKIPFNGIALNEPLIGNTPIESSSNNCDAICNNGAKPKKASLSSLSHLQQMSALSLSSFSLHNLPLETWPSVHAMPLESVLSERYTPYKDFVPNTSSSELLRNLHRTAESRSETRNRDGADIFVGKRSDVYMCNKSFSEYSSNINDDILNLMA